MVSKPPIITVYTMQDNSVSIIGVVQNFTSISYNPKFDEPGKFSLVIPFSKQDFNLFLGYEGREKIIHIEDGIIGICQKISCKFSNKSRTLTIQGQLGEALLDNAILGPYNYVPNEDYTIQDHIKQALQNLSLLRSTLWEAIDFEEITTDSSFITPEEVVAGKSTFGEFVRVLCKSCNKGYKVRLDLQTLKLNFSLCDYTDRGLSSENPVYISRELSSLGNSEFSINSQQYKNRLMTWTEYDLNGQTQSAVLQIDYDEPSKRPSSKKEMRADYVKIDITSETAISSFSEAYARLNSEGKQALYDATYVKAYNCELDDDSSSVYKFNTDYFLGDIIVVDDKQIGITVDVKLLEYTKTFDLKGVHFDPVFGVSQPSLNAVLKRNKIIR